jgi:hypothetical protein
LPEACPICQHSPVDAEDCKPNKSLRITINAFVKTELKKRDKEAVASVPPQPVVPSIEASTPLDISAESAAPRNAQDQVNGNVASGDASTAESILNAPSSRPGSVQGKASAEHDVSLTTFHMCVGCR